MSAILLPPAVSPDMTAGRGSDATEKRGVLTRRHAGVPIFLLTIAAVAAFATRIHAPVRPRLDLRTNVNSLIRE